MRGDSHISPLKIVFDFMFILLLITPLVVVLTLLGLLPQTFVLDYTLSILLSVIVFLAVIAIILLINKAESKFGV